MNDKHPKVFVSYAWKNEQTRNGVCELVNRLMHHGVDVVWDKWDLKEGDDKYVFMERSVTDESITNVLIICDKVYKERADRREGGVGDETTVITPEIYGKSVQSKFIPVVFERDESNAPYLPSYIKSRIYVDLSDENEYEKSYEKLLRRLWKKPEEQKPALGKMPSWLENENINYNELNSLIKQLRHINNTQEKKYSSLNVRFVDALIEILNNMRFIDDKFNSETLLKKIDELKPIRDICFEFFEVNLDNDMFSIDFITEFFERIYNEVGVIESSGYNDEPFEYYNFFRWESFIGVVALFRHYERYSEIHDLLNHTYFLRDSWFKNAITIPRNFPEFHKHFRILQNDCQDGFKNKYISYPAKMLTEREKRPILNKEDLAETDLFLYQMSTIICNLDDGFTSRHNQWFPEMYIYVKKNNVWTKLKSLKYCRKLFPLFGVKSIDELKNDLSKAKYDPQFSHSTLWNAPPNILSYVSLNDIASLK